MATALSSNSISLNRLVPPHGGRLVDRIVPPHRAEEVRHRALSLPRICLNPRELSDLELLAIGAYSPLEGFVTRRDYDTVVAEMHLSNGIAWSLPVTLSASREEAENFREGKDIALLAPEEELAGILHLEEKFSYDKEREAREVYGTTDPAHPGVKALLEQREVLLGGKISYLPAPRQLDFAVYRLTPQETRRLFEEKGWRRVAAFQTRNPIHRAHEYIQKCALEIADGLFLHPLVGETKSDDIPARVRMQCYEALLKNYYPPERVVLAVFPAAMRYAGPREAIFHALVRKNYGSSHFIVGRDHAGIGNYYGPFDAQKIFDQFSSEELGVTPLFFDNAFYCHLCQGMASAKTCPHPSDQHMVLSGTQLRSMLHSGELPPSQFTRPEVARILLQAFRDRGKGE